jgi:hypothetical protein
MSKETNVNQNIMLAKSMFQQENMEKGEPAFIGIPMSPESAFVEILWDPVRSTLGVISKIKKESFHFLPKLGGSGAPLPNNDQKSNQQMPFQQERIKIETFHEYFITDLEDIRRFLTTFVYNQDFDWDKFVGVVKKKK